MLRHPVGAACQEGAAHASQTSTSILHHVDAWGAWAAAVLAVPLHILCSFFSGLYYISLQWTQKQQDAHLRHAPAACALLGSHVACTSILRCMLHPTS